MKPFTFLSFLFFLTILFGCQNHQDSVVSQKLTLSKVNNVLREELKTNFPNTDVELTEKSVYLSIGERNFPNRYNITPIHQFDTLLSYYNNVNLNLDSIDESKRYCYEHYIETIESHPEKYSKVIGYSYIQKIEIKINENLSYFGEIPVIIYGKKLSEFSKNEIRKCKFEYLKLKNSNCQ